MYYIDSSGSYVFVLVLGFRFLEIPDELGAVAGFSIYTIGNLGMTK